MIYEIAQDSSRDNNVIHIVLLLFEVRKLWGFPFPVLPTVEKESVFQNEIFEMEDSSLHCASTSSVKYSVSNSPA